MILGEAGNRIHGTTHERPLTRFEETERHLLKALPDRAPKLAVWAKVKVHGNCHVQFEKCHYSVPYRLVRQSLWLRACETTTQIFRENELIATHPRLRTPGSRSIVHGGRCRRCQSRKAAKTRRPMSSRYRLTTQSLAEAQQMYRAVEQARVIHQVGLVLNFSPVYTVLADLMSGDWGPLLAAHMRDDQFFPIRGEYGSTWRADVTKAGGGTLLEHSIHDVDLFRRLFGEVRSVQCRTRQTSGRTGIEDTALVSFHHEGGYTTTLASIWHAIDSRPSGRHLEVFFERARFTTEQDYFGTITYEIDDAEPVTLSNDEILARFMRLRDLNPEEEDLRSLAGLGDRRFLQAALVGRPASPDFADALRSHVIVDACYQSAEAAGATVKTE